MAAARLKLTVIVATCIGLMAAGLAFVQWSTARSFDARHVRWLREQMPTYDKMAENILAHKERLTSQPADISDLVPRPFKASAVSSTDRSVTIVFPGGEGGPRHGYIYHSGPLLTNLPGDPDAYIYHLTNQSYEY